MHQVGKVVPRAAIRPIEVGPANSIQSGVYRRAPQIGQFAGYARPVAQAISKYILVDMYAKAVQGMVPADAVKWAMEDGKNLRLIRLTP